MTAPMSAEASFSSGRHGWRPAGTVDLETRLRRARRHSRFVRLLRFGIPVAVIGLIGLQWLAAWFNPFATLAGVEIGDIVISRSQVAMDRPRMSGFTRDGRSYALNAATATQDLRRPQFIELKGIIGKVEMSDGDVVNITADAGVYDTKAETVVLRQNVRVITSDGTHVRMEEALVDARNGRVLSERAVEIVSERSRLNAKQMDLQQGGDVVTFRGGVTMDLTGMDRVKKEPAQ
jgi:lipopolysaccharide export system protein LptC